MVNDKRRATNIQTSIKTDIERKGERDERKGKKGEKRKR